MSRSLALAVLAAACSGALRKDASPPLSSQAPQAAAQAAATAGSPALSEQEMIEHVLDRTTFGPRKADRQHVREAGIAAFLEEQLHPDQLDDSQVSQKLASIEVLNTSSDALVQRLYAERKKKQQEKK